MRRPARLPIEELAPYLLEPGEGPGLIRWAEVFGNDAPVEIEVGFGKGLFLLNASEACPQTNFLGIEIVRKYQLFTATRLAKRERGNVRVLCGDARQFFRDRVGSGTVQAVHVYFPDPWWKKRHHKRRVFTPGFVADCARILAPGGRLHAVTDVPDYADLIRTLVAAEPSFVPGEAPDESAAEHEMDYLTNFERKFRKEGKPIHRLGYVRAGNPYSEEG